MRADTLRRVPFVPAPAVGNVTSAVIREGHFVRFIFGPTATIRTAATLLEEARAISAGSGDVEVDCSTLEQCDAAGLQVLASLQLAMRRDGRALRISGVPDAASWRFRAMGLEGAKS